MQHSTCLDLCRRFDGTHRLSPWDVIVSDGDAFGVAAGTEVGVVAASEAAVVNEDGAQGVAEPAGVENHGELVRLAVHGAPAGIVQQPVRCRCGHQ